MASEMMDKALNGLDQAVSAVRAAAEQAPEAATAATGGAIDPFVFQLALFVLSLFVGYYVVWSVTPALHTPLMAVTNAISSVIVVGALLAVGVSASGYATGFGFLALVLVSVNIFGGFMVTSRMLAMYRRKER
jgi:NAD(P) transhydrogenase subunit alpha